MTADDEQVSVYDMLLAAREEVTALRAAATRVVNLWSPPADSEPPVWGEWDAAFEALALAVGSEETR